MAYPGNMTDSLREAALPVIAGLKACHKQTQGPVLLAIDGRSGTGKTTFAKIVGSQLSSTLIGGDDFFAGGVVVQEKIPEALADSCIDRRRLRRVLKTLKSGQEARFAAFDWNAFDGRLADTQTHLPLRPFLIVEGVYAYHPDLRDLVDVSVMMDTPEAERTQRLLAREGHLSAWERQWFGAEDWYFSTLSRPEHFGFVVRNAGPP